MRYIIVYQRQSETGETHYKWVPSPYYEWSAEHLIKLIEKERQDFDKLVAPFILTISASLEANLNDWMLIDTFNKHGPENYKSIAEAYTGAQFAKKLRLAVAVMTDNNFHLREDSPIVHKLDELIASRNKITHPLTFFQYREQSDEDGKLKMDKIDNHPLQSLTAEKCREYYQAVVDFDRLFFGQYDKGEIEENELIQGILRPNDSHDGRPDKASSS